MSQTNFEIDLCRICFKANNLNAYSADYIDFLINFIGVEDAPLCIRLCPRCETCFKKTIDFIQQVKNAERIWKHGKPYDDNVINLSCDQITPTLNQGSMVNSSCENFDTTDIKEANETKSNDASDHEDSESSRLQQINTTNYTREENVDKCKKMKRLKKIDEMDYDIRILSNNEILAEIKLKTLADEYKTSKYKCPPCGKMFVSGQVYGEHRARHDPTSGDHACDICTLRFKSKDVLSQHTLGHRRRFHCKVCNAVFTRRWQCVVHRHKCGCAQNPVVCCSCAKIFSDAMSLEAHIRGVHRVDKKHRCEQCAARFATRGKLAVHMRSHTGLKEFPCERCPRTFATNSNLRAHRAVHSPRAHYCVECDAHYSSEKGLKRHLLENSKHLVKENLIYPCPDCPKRYASEKAMRSHRTSRHLTTHTCGVCNKTFSSRTNLRKHQRCVHSVESSDT